MFNTIKMFRLLLTICLLIAEGYSSRIKIETSPSEPKIGDNVYMVCRANPDSADVTYKWSRNGQTLSNTAELRFEPFRREDLGYYKCYVDSPSFWAEQTTYLNDYTPTPSYIINIDATPKLFQQNGPLTLDCNVKPRPANARYVWTRNDVVVGNNERLYFPSEVQNGGVTYKCTVDIYSPNGNTDSLYATISYTGSPSWTDNYFKYSIDINTSPSVIYFGQPLTMICKLNGPDIANIRYEWYKNGRYVIEGPEYIIQKVDSYDQGEYKCIGKGSNYSGQTFQREMTFTF